MKKKERYMKRALELAKKGDGYVNPNPQVGAVVVKNDEIVGEGYHREFGGPHAEVNAIKAAGQNAKGADLYVNLEPCVHFGKTPPCVDKIIDSKLKRVFIAMKDPNEKVNGKGVRKLKRSGIDVEVGVCKEAALNLNEIYIHYVKTKRPFVGLKLGMSMDGKIATKTGHSKWITGEVSRKRVHELRSKFSSIGVGVNTALKDDPRLTVRLVKGKNPVRFVLDSRGKVQVSAKLLQENMKGQTIVATTDRISTSKKEELRKAGAKFWVLNDKEGQVDLDDLLEKVGKAGFDSFLIEGGGEVAWSFLEKDLVDKFYFFKAPKVLGGRNAVPSVGGEGFSRVDEALELKNISIEYLGNDILLTSYPK